MRRILAILGTTLALWLVVPAAPALACTCALQTAQSHFVDADIVFSGTVSSVTRDGDLQRVRLDVDLVYKGDPDTGVEVRTPGSSDACGIQFGRERRYLVFAGTSDGDYTTGLCSGTTDDVQLLEREGIRGQAVTLVTAAREDPVAGATATRIPQIAVAIAALAGVLAVHVVRFRRLTG